MLGFFSSARFLLTLLLFVGLAILDSQKIDMGIGVVCMTNHTAIDRIENIVNPELISLNNNHLLGYSLNKNFLHVI